MIIYSEKTKKNYTSPDECLKAEKEYDAEIARQEAEKKKLQDARKARAEEIETARAEMVKAQNHYRELIDAFCKDYGHYHYSTDKADNFPWLFDFIKFW